MASNRRTAADFVAQVYDGELAGFWEGLINAGRAILMEDGAPNHRAQALEKWRDERSVEKLEWTANSLYLNPIENVWAKMKAAIQKLPKDKNSEERWLQLKQTWSIIDPEWLQLQHLVNSMSERIKAVIEAKGGSTRWCLYFFYVDYVHYKIVIQKNLSAGLQLCIL
ncbi:unnamed protein product [Albugo candida]|uniref:Tc1-like transposase DDE domain-containing protein n=1 Tax=Albugo candida TaxID=65357 RepID=A0A024FWD6_9STRA|nr:unnamed protein product [Albugo candida]|eukprot:CCI11237.1 unnamed protein product [Albugo candida]